MGEIVHIDISYQEDVPVQIIQELVDAINRPGVIAQGRPRPVGMFASMEWAVPTIIIAYLMRPYFEAFLAEAGKDHYLVLKRAFSKLFLKIYGNEPEKRPHRRSMLFSIQSGMRDGRLVKAIFPEGVSHETYSVALTELLELLAEHHVSGSPDRLSEIIAPSSGWGGELYVEYSESVGNWILLDPKTEIAKRRKAMNPNDNDEADISDGS